MLNHLISLPARPLMSSIAEGKGMRHSLRAQLHSGAGMIAVAATLVMFALGVASVQPGATVGSLRLLMTFSALTLCYVSSFWGLWAGNVDMYEGLPFSPRRIALAERDRLMWSLAPTIMGSLGILVPLVLRDDVGLLLIATGFVLLMVLEGLGKRRGMPVADFLWLRWIVGGVAVLVLCNVLSDHRLDIGLIF